MNTELEQWKSTGHYFTYKGHQIFYRKEGSGPFLLLIHGYPYNSFDFERIWEPLVARYTVIAPDMLGMGFSDKPLDYDYSLFDMTEQFLSLARLLGVKETHLLSHDLGNAVIQELIARDSERNNPFAIKSIAFLNGGLFTDTYRPRFIQVLLSRSPDFIGRFLSKVISRARVEAATSSVFGPSTQPSQRLLDNYWEILNYNNGKAITYKMGRLVFEKEKYQERWIYAMQQTLIPMCFINGPADPNSGRHMAVRYAELIPQANIKLLAHHIGHWPQWEAPEQVLLAYYNFLQNELHTRSK